MSKKILILDDYAVGLTLLRTQLVRAGYAVYEARNGREGLDLVIMNKPDLVVLDVEMPKMDGLAFLQAFNAIEGMEDVPVIVLTAHEERKGAFAAEGVTEYLVKPVNAQELIDKIKAMVGS